MHLYIYIHLYNYLSIYLSVCVSVYICMYTYDVRLYVRKKSLAGVQFRGAGREGVREKDGERVGESGRETRAAT